MATYDDLCAAIEEVPLPFARIQFDPDDPEGIPEVPFVILTPLRTHNKMGSNRVAMAFDPYDVELYTELSDMELEGRVEDALERHGFAYQRSHQDLGDGIVEVVWSTFCDG